MAPRVGAALALNRERDVGTITVDVAGLKTAFLAAKPGDTLAVKPGTISKFRPGKPTWDASALPITITAADPANPPVFADGVTMDAWNDFVWRGVVFDIRKGTADFAAAVSTFTNATTPICKNIAFEYCEFFGLSDPTTLINPTTKAEYIEYDGVGYGLKGNYDGLRVVKNKFHDLSRGIVLGDSSNVDILDNDITNILVDNIQFGGVIGLRILRNRLEKKELSTLSGSHPDGIQGIKGGRPSVDVVIADNLILCPPTGKGSQGVFQADDPLCDRIVIRNNTILNSGYRALSTSAQQVDVLDNIAVSCRADASSGLYWVGVTGRADGNVVGKVVSAPVGAQNTVVGTVTPEKIEEYRAAWMAKFRPAATPEPTPEPEPVDPHLAEIAALKAQVAALTSNRSEALALAQQAAGQITQARLARAKNQYIDQAKATVDQLITKLSAPIS